VDDVRPEQWIRWLAAIQAWTDSRKFMALRSIGDFWRKNASDLAIIGRFRPARLGCTESGPPITSREVDDSPLDGKPIRTFQKKRRQHPRRQAAARPGHYIRAISQPV